MPKKKRPVPTFVDAGVKVCEACGARYSLQSLSIPMRDKDSIDCECGQELIAWNGGVTYMSTRLPDVPAKR